VADTNSGKVEKQVNEWLEQQADNVNIYYIQYQQSSGSGWSNNIMSAIILYSDLAPDKVIVT
jgi:hypothetical protein